MDPLVSLLLRDNRRQYEPGDVLDFEYQIDAVKLEDMQALEVSVLWTTDGKGESDLGVHFFERRVTSDPRDGDLRELRRRKGAASQQPAHLRGCERQNTLAGAVAIVHARFEGLHLGTAV